LAFYGLYGGALRHALLRLKFDGHLYLAPLLGNFLLEAAACLPRPDALTAVPQHPDHLRRRGYNQAHEIAKALRDLSGLPLQAQLLARDVPGPEQARLDARNRRSNVLHSFAAAPNVAGKRVWLVDDIMTTGSTLAAATKALLKGGAARVDVLFIARTVRDAPLSAMPQSNVNAT
jgi:Predicted amidophosphoribosyltransferases